RQALVPKPRPMIVMTPKSLLRLPAAASRIEDLSDRGFQPVIDDQKLAGTREEVTRLVLCTGKIYYDLVGSEERATAKNVAIARVELLYPFAANELRSLIESYPSVRQVVWVQEEPKNMGARAFMRLRFLGEAMPDGVEYEYVGREFRASPGEGYPAAH